MLPSAVLTPEKVETLTAFLTSPERPAGTLRYVELRGYLFAIANSPRMLMPSEWIHRIFGEDGREQMVWDDVADASLVYGCLMAVWNDVRQTGDDEKASPQWLFGDEGADDSLRQTWSVGFQLGWEMVEHHWGEALSDLEEEHGKWFGICQFCLRYFADPERLNREEQIPEGELEDWAERMNELFPTAAQYYARLGKMLYHLNPRSAGDGSRGPIRVEKGPGRNDPCPCGSGKKYKKCCLK